MKNNRPLRFLRFSRIKSKAIRIFWNFRYLKALDFKLHYLYLLSLLYLLT